MSWSGADRLENELPKKNWMERPIIAGQLTGCGNTFKLVNVYFGGLAGHSGGMFLC